jgi:hypothetical protein
MLARPSLASGQAKRTCSHAPGILATIPHSRQRQRLGAEIDQSSFSRTGMAIRVVSVWVQYAYTVARPKPGNAARGRLSCAVRFKVQVVRGGSAARGECAGCFNSREQLAYVS